ncbi:hypothetical protein JGI12_01609 [Candidatus Kryptonium thompsonii]|nr:hypothetical protein JGI12_01609 [Candidatus Kryptonium thompsoni]
MKLAGLYLRQERKNWDLGKIKSPRANELDEIANELKLYPFTKT